MSSEALIAVCATAITVVGALVTVAIAWGRTTTRLDAIARQLELLAAAVTKRLDEHSERLDERASKHHRMAGVVQLLDHRTRTIEHHLSLTPIGGIDTRLSTEDTR